MRNPLVALFWLLVAGGVINYFLSSTPITMETREKMQEAYQEYVRGETAPSVEERRSAFNEALRLYTALEEEYKPTFSSGKLYYNIANSYFQVEQVPQAILYYYRAQQLMPREERVGHNLDVAKKKLGVGSGEKQQSVFDNVLFFYTHFSLPERLQAFFWLSVMATISYSLFLWNQSKWMKIAAQVAALLAAAVLLVIGYGHFFAATEAVILHSTPLFRDAGFQYAKVMDAPVVSGSKVKVLDVKEKGGWLKIATSNGQIGYVPSDSMRMI